MSSNCLVTVVIPAKNEAKTVASIVQGCRPYADQILVVDGHSTDGTFEIARNSGAEVILDHGRGKGDAIQTAIDHIRGEITVFIDADGSPDAADIPRLIEPIQQEEADHVGASQRIGALLAESGFAVITGGGPGAMEAANRGAKSVGGRTVGLNIKLPFEQKPNKYSDPVINFDYFFVRKVMFVKYACAFIGLPGGYGTLDEMFECLTLRQTGKIKNFPVILFGTSFWSGLVDWLRDQCLQQGLISKRDLKMFRMVDSPEEAVDIITQSYRRRQREEAQLEDADQSPT